MGREMLPLSASLMFPVVYFPLSGGHVYQKQNDVKSHGRLVLVSFKLYSSSTPSLSNS